MAEQFADLKDFEGCQTQISSQKLSLQHILSNHQYLTEKNAKGIKHVYLSDMCSKVF